MSKQSASRKRRENAAYEAYHRADADTVQRIALDNRERILMNLLQSEGELHTERRLAGTVYSATPYGKHYSAAKQEERTKRSDAKKAANQAIFLNGGFVSESNYVSYVKNLLLNFSDPDLDDAQASGRFASQYVRFTPHFVGTIMSAIVWAETHARLKWGAQKAAMLTMRAERIVEWYRAREAGGVFDPSCSNERHALERAISRGIALRRKLSDGLSDVNAYHAWWRENQHVFRDWEALVKKNRPYVRYYDRPYRDAASREAEVSSILESARNFDGFIPEPEKPGFIGPIPNAGFKIEHLFDWNIGALPVE